MRWFLVTAVLSALTYSLLVLQGECNKVAAANSPALQAESPDNAAPQPNPNTVSDWSAFQPKWHIGQQWIVETETGSPARSSSQSPAKVKIRWRFTVQKQEQLGERNCWRLEIDCREAMPNPPRTVLWLDVRSLQLLQFQTQIPTSRGLQTLTESYYVSEGQTSPVLGFLTVLPLDFPVFVSSRAKSGNEFHYISRSGVRGEKSSGRAFSVPIKQQVRIPEAKVMDQLTLRQFAKGTDRREYREVILTQSGRTVRQLWGTRLPWPVFANNGTSTARLIEVLPRKSSPR